MTIVAELYLGDDYGSCNNMYILVVREQVVEGMTNTDLFPLSQCLHREGVRHQIRKDQTGFFGVNPKKEQIMVCTTEGTVTCTIW